METALVLIMVLVSLSFILKLTFMPSWLVWVECIMLALFVVMAVDLASSQSKTRIQEWIQSPALMLDMAVVITVDVSMQLAFCINHVSNALSMKEKFIRWSLIVSPGFMILPVTFAALVQLLFLFTGTDFGSIAYSFAGLLLVSVPLVAYGMKWLLPATIQRLELIFYVNCIIAMLGVVTTVNGQTAAAGISDLNIPALMVVALLIVIGFAIGFFFFKYKNKHQI